MLLEEVTDHVELAQIEQRLHEASDRLGHLVLPVGKARQVIEFSSDMRKRALAKAIVPFLDAGETVSAADAKARASFPYGEELKELAVQLKDAETVRAQFEAAKVEWESARSLLSLQKSLSQMQ